MALITCCTLSLLSFQELSSPAQSTGAFQRNSREMINCCTESGAEMSKEAVRAKLLAEAEAAIEALLVRIGLKLVLLRFA